MKESRRAPRVPGPFEGRHIGESTVGIRLHGLSIVGCLIQSAHDVPVGRQISIEIDLPYEGTVTLEAESVNTRPGYGYGVAFVDMTNEVRDALERIIEWRVTGLRHLDRTTDGPGTKDEGRTKDQARTTDQAPNTDHGPRTDEEPSTKYPGLKRSTRVQRRARNS